MFFLLSCSGDHRELHVLTHSFPTRRSSDLPVQDAIRAAQAIAAGTGRYRPALQAQRIASKAHAALGEAAYHILIGQIVVPGKLMFITDIEDRKSTRLNSSR